MKKKRYGNVRNRGLAKWKLEGIRTANEAESERIERREVRESGEFEPLKTAGGNMVRLTHGIVDQGATANGVGWSRSQLECFGIAWPPKTGWKNRIVGKLFPRGVVERFLNLRKGGRQGGRKLPKPQPAPQRIVQVSPALESGFKRFFVEAEKPLPNTAAERQRQAEEQGNAAFLAAGGNPSLLLPSSFPGALEGVPEWTRCIQCREWIYIPRMAAGKRCKCGVPLESTR